MKVVILAGGFGTRISEESELKPKPMIEIGGMPIIWHIMKEYSYYGHNEFIICAGYKQHMIKEWFADYFLYTSDVTFDLTNNNQMIVHDKKSEPWKVTIVDTGLESLTGERIRRVKNYVNGEKFLLTYGDGVCDVDINEIIKFHESHNKIATITAVRNIQQKGVLEILEDHTVKSFREKNASDGALINAGYMVLEPEIFDYLKEGNISLEKDVLPVLTDQEQLMSYIHNGYWQCMDTIREKMELEKLWSNNQALWKKW